VPEASAWKMVGVELQNSQAVSQDLIRRYRDERLERFDAALRAIWPAVEAGQIDAIDCFLRIEHRRSCLLGLDSADEMVVRDNASWPALRALRSNDQTKG
jgi:hypothetical protein